MAVLSWIATNSRISFCFSGESRDELELSIVRDGAAFCGWATGDTGPNSKAKIASNAEAVIFIASQHESLAGASQSHSNSTEAEYAAPDMAADLQVDLRSRPRGLPGTPVGPLLAPAPALRRRDTPYQAGGSS